ncbi:hypothetical protein [Hoeflea sp. TYP-13]|uniref:DUF4376 domain-containing protein n=1 Tax=Hoeflea sp. TYP-13 TaxID=3230023 RepID=UPI0034C5BA3B
MPLTKLVNGKEVALTDEEEAEFRAEWARNDAARNAVTAEHINTERERRKYLPKTVSLSTGKAFPVDMVNGGRENIANLSLFALVKKGAGDTSTFLFADADNNDQTLSNDEMLEVGVQCAQQITAIHQKARVLKALQEKPADYTDLKHWL